MPLKEFQKISKITIIPTFSESEYAKFARMLEKNEAEKLLPYSEFLDSVEIKRQRAIDENSSPRIISVDVEHFKEWCIANNHSITIGALTPYSTRGS